MALVIKNRKTISELYTAHVAPVQMEKSEKWFLRRDTKDPNRMPFFSTKGTLSTVEEKTHWDRHPKFVSLQTTCVCLLTTWMAFL